MHRRRPEFGWASAGAHQRYPRLLEGRGRSPAAQRDGVRPRPAPARQRAPGAAAGVTLPTPPAIALKGDERRLLSCVVNLLANAIKFAPRGEVTVSAAVADSAGLEIRIADTGCGIPADQLERVFEPLPPGRERAQPSHQRPAAELQAGIGADELWEASAAIA
ncbi:MAG: hypothetical protein C0484_01220 [Rhodospirillum sp.]|nr:hypothetical protein [Rhodospirillum sp.]